MNPDLRPTFPLKKVLLIIGIIAAAIIITVGILYRSLKLRTKTQQQTIDTTWMNKLEDTVAENIRLIIAHDTAQTLIENAKHPAWNFENADIAEVMWKLHTCYRVDYFVSNSITNRFTGIIPANTSLDKTLRLLEKMGHGHINFERSPPNRVSVIVDSLIHK